MTGLWATLEGLANIACVIWIIAFVVGLIRPQVLKQTERMGVVRVCAMGFFLSFLLLAFSWSKLHGHI